MLRFCKYLIKYIVLFLIGGVLFNLVEFLWRGYSFFEMTIVGGLCFVLIGGINELFPWDMALTSQMLLSAAAVTGVELVAGLIFNVWLGLGIWDYSDQCYQFMGQVCLLYFNLWFLLSAIGILLDDFIRWKFFGEEKPQYKIF
ncbi:MAG TPA: hypothetical protein IAB04_08470 [Candidatus Avimonoglobus intestinipullorum]|uniref:ABC-transporter type IV n=1 Tax=Candidatus Avimonoglobus intestinipullorum TaxID=2840699 RepID=A0A9D1LWM1_9FIRM|nr:hypothetical protein [Candidatus Avimonoglobus intestinipullorum]